MSGDYERALVLLRGFQVGDRVKYAPEALVGNKAMIAWHGEVVGVRGQLLAIKWDGVDSSPTEWLQTHLEPE